ncbi:energy-coupling factor transporter transmembrane protein EcfT [Streptomyces sp. NBC_01351]|uniref:hypothetical protein n=1 Tax=Streptomyces sp. NBC_01351 TaxID=2903833 RepID=UPI002E30A3C5|nr:hypothetical protein [Streptomyces sp. NBC_01351]
MKGTDFRESWYERRLPYWLLGLVVLAVGLGGLLSAQAIVDGYRKTVVYQQAPVCEGDGCVQARTGEVRDRVTGERCTSNGTNTGATGGETCTTTYSLKVVWSGRSQWLEVGAEAYTEAGTGERAQLRLWKGQVVGLEVLGHSRRYPPASQTDMWPSMALAWLALGVASWALASGRVITLLPMGFGWFMVSILIFMIGPDVLMWSPPVYWGALTVLAGGVTYGARAIFRF